MTVPRGEPDQAACLTCGTPLPGGPGLRCAHCGRWLGAPLAIELTAAAVTALLIGRFGAQPAVAAFGYLGVLGVALAQVDGAVQRLPDRLTLPAYPAVLVLLALAAVASRDPAALVRALLGGLALGAAYLALGLLSGGQLGGGDVKLAGLLGLVLGWSGWPVLIAGACLGFFLAALTGIALLATRRITRHAALSFGPFMLTGALIALVAASS